MSRSTQACCLSVAIKSLLLFALITLLYTEPVSCPLCGNDDAVTLTTEHYSLDSSSAALPIVRCKHCDLVRVTPRLTDRSRSAVYENDSLNTISHAYCWKESSRTSRFNPLLKRLKAINNAGLFLDAGCGAGDLLKVAEKLGDRTLIGAGPSAPAANIARRKNRLHFIAARSNKPLSKPAA